MFLSFPPKTNKIILLEFGNAPPPFDIFKYLAYLKGHTLTNYSDFVSPSASVRDCKTLASPPFFFSIVYIKRI